MPLEAHIIEPVTGQIDPELSARINAEQHAILFSSVAQQPSRFPLLMRMSDFYSGTEYATDELETLIAEVENT